RSRCRTGTDRAKGGGPPEHDGQGPRGDLEREARRRRRLRLGEALLRRSRGGLTPARPLPGPGSEVSTTRGQVPTSVRCSPGQLPHNGGLRRDQARPVSTTLVINTPRACPACGSVPDLRFDELRAGPLGRAARGHGVLVPLLPRAVGDVRVAADAV